MSTNGNSTGKLLEIKGVVVDAVFTGKLPAIYSALRIPRADGPDLIAEVQQHLGDDRVRAVAMDATDGIARGTDVFDTGGPISVPVGEVTLGRVWNVLGDPVDEKPRGRTRCRALVDPPRPARLRGPLAEGRDLRDRHQGHRPDRAVRARRQDRPVRRRRRRQDGADPGADPQRRAGARRRVGLLRRRRAHARGQRPAPRDGGVGRARQGRARLRPDERAARSAPARRPLRPDDGGVLPRRRPGRAALHRQHLPVHAGGLRGVGAPRPHAERRRLPADARDRDGAAAGAHHDDEQGLGHLDPGDLRACRRLHRPGAGDDVRPPRLVGRARPRDRGAGDLPGDEPARLVLARAPAGHRLRRALRGRDARAGDPAALQGPAGHHRHPRHRGALGRRPAHGLARTQDPALPVAAELRRRAVHRHARPVREARGHDPRLRRDHRRPARRPARAGVLHGRPDRRRGRAGEADVRLP